MTGRALLAAPLVLVPAPAAACAVCLTSAFGDRGFNVAFVAFMVTPFVVIAAVGSVLVWLGAARGRRAPDARSEEGTRC